MTWTTLPPHVRHLAERVCTDAELDALKLWDAGYGYARLGAALGISRSAARDRVKNGMRKITAELERFDEGDVP